MDLLVKPEDDSVGAMQQNRLELIKVGFLLLSSNPEFTLI
jgi:hypothetical protein